MYRGTDEAGPLIIAQAFHEFETGSLKRGWGVGKRGLVVGHRDTVVQGVNVRGAEGRDWLNGRVLGERREKLVLAGKKCGGGRLARDR